MNMPPSLAARLLASYAPAERRDISDEGRARRIVAGLRRGYRLHEKETHL